MKKILILAMVLGFQASALEGFYVGGQVGHMGLTSPTSSVYKNSIGFGLDLGLRTSPDLDVMLQSHYGSFSGGVDGLKIFSQTVGANLHYQVGDFDFTASFGPGFYFLSAAGLSNTEFGLHTGVGADVIASPELRVGLGFRYHGIFGDNNDDYSSVMLRVGYLFSGN